MALAMHHTLAKGVKVGYLAWGHGPCNVVLMHAHFCTVHFWEGLMESLPADRYRCVAIDYLVESERPWGGWTVSGFADMMRDLMDVLGMDRAVIGGHSLGGITAQVFALRFPERVEKLLLVGTGATSEGHGKYQEFVEYARTAALDREDLVNIHRAFWSTNPPDERIQPYIDHLMRAPKEALREALYSAGIYDLRPQLPYIQVPTLMCHGTLDTGRTMEHANQIKEGVPDSKLVLFETGHAIPLEAAEEFNRTVRAFLDDNSP